MDVSGLDLNAVRVFVAVVEVRSFREAGRRLGVPRSTVSRRVAELEAQLGVQLLRRTTRSVALTAEGEVFAARAAAGVSGLLDAAKQLTAAREVPSGTLTLTAPPTFAELFLADVMSEYLATYPEVRVAADLTDRFVDLVPEGVDVAIRAGALPDSSLKARLLGTSRLVCVASPGYLERHPAPTTPAGLDAHDCLVFAPPGRQVTWAFGGKPKGQSVVVRAKVALNSFVMLVNLARAGLGVARLPERLVEADLRAGRLVELLRGHVPPAVPMHVVLAPGAELAPRVRAFVELLVARLTALRGE